MENESVSNVKRVGLKETSSKKRTTVAIIGVVIVAAVLIVIILLFIPSKDNGIMVFSEAALEKVVEINDMSTIEYSYNAIVTAYTEEGREKYHVAYEGLVKAGIDFDKITFDVKEEEKVLRITLPEVEIQRIDVDMGTLDYIFVKSVYETATVSEEAYKLSLADLEQRVNEEQLLFDTARENAITSLKGLLQPWVDSGEYQIEFISEEEATA